MVDYVEVARATLALSVTAYGAAKGWSDIDTDAVFEKALSLSIRETTTPRGVRMNLDYIYEEILREKEKFLKALDDAKKKAEENG